MTTFKIRRRIFQWLDESCESYQEIVNEIMKIEVLEAVWEVLEAICIESTFSFLYFESILLSRVFWMFLSVLLKEEIRSEFFSGIFGKFL